MSSLSGAVRVTSLALGGLGLLAASGCEDDTKYAYFSVRVTIAEPADAIFLARIARCGANVEGADSDFASLACAPARSRDLGTFEWSTAETMGNVRFRVTLSDGIGTVLGEGVSTDVPIVIGATTPATVVVTPVPPMTMPDSGPADSAALPDSGVADSAPLPDSGAAD